MHGKLSFKDYGIYRLTGKCWLARRNLSQSSVGKKFWWLYILPQYLANLTQPLYYAQRKPYFGNICHFINGILYARFEAFKKFLYVFITAFC